jgi:hypothetical protein
MLDGNDLALIEAARDAIRKCYKPDGGGANIKTPVKRLLPHKYSRA